MDVCAYHVHDYETRYKCMDYHGDDCCGWRLLLLECGIRRPIITSTMGFRKTWESDSRYCSSSFNFGISSALHPFCQFSHCLVSFIDILQARNLITSISALSTRGLDELPHFKAFGHIHEYPLSITRPRVPGWRLYICPTVRSWIFTLATTNDTLPLFSYTLSTQIYFCSRTFTCLLDQGSLRTLNPERLLRANRIPYAVEVKLKYDVEY